MTTKLTAEEIRKEANMLLSMACNVADGTLEAARDEFGVIVFSMTEKGRAEVEAMGRPAATGRSWKAARSKNMD